MHFTGGKKVEHQEFHPVFTRSEYENSKHRIHKIA